MRGVWTRALLIVAGFLAAECVVRLLGYEPWGEKTAPPRGDLLVADDILGWKNVPGRYRNLEPIAAPRGIATIIDGGCRRASPEQRTCEGDVWTLGCSFTFGQGVDDTETYPWQLQERLPSHRIVNFGVRAYGTIQVKGVIARLLPPNSFNKVLVYGFIEDHESRNIAAPMWWAPIATNVSAKNVRVPYLDFVNGAWLEVPPTPVFYELPGRALFSSVRIAELVLATAQSFSRVHHARAATLEAISRTAALTHERGARFVFVNLYSGDDQQAFYNAKLSEIGIDTLDCRGTVRSDARMRLPNDEHPNAAGYTQIANCVAAGVQRLEQSSPLPRFAEDVS